jgi:predicted component of type VI protein secretion system
MKLTSQQHQHEAGNLNNISTKLEIFNTRLTSQQHQHEVGNLQHEASASQQHEAGNI